MNRLLLFTLLILVSFTQSQAAIYEPNVLWNKSDIKVCFYDQVEQIDLTPFRLDKESLKKQNFKPDFLSKSQKNKIRKIIQNNYSKEKTGIEFSGWEDCSDSNEFDVIVLKASKIKLFNRIPFVGNASIGEQGVWSESPEGFFEKDLSIKSTVIFQDTTPFVITHEFGHVAGLRHEQKHPKSHICFTSNESLGKTAVILKKYDIDSIMSHCRGRDDEGDPKLSDLDKSTLKEIYSNR